VAKKPAWIIEKERGRKAAAAETIWLFGLHAVRDALLNPAREKLRLVVTRNALDRLGEAVASAGVEPEIADPRKFPAPLDPGSVHQGAALEDAAARLGQPGGPGAGRRRAAARASRPGLRPAQRGRDPALGRGFRRARGGRPGPPFGPETGALAKTASGALERQPYLRVPNLGNAIEALKSMGYLVIGLDGEGPIDIARAAADARGRPAALVLGAEGPGLRARTRELCDVLARIPAAGEFGSLNVSNAAAVSLYALRPD
jgi:23S rRNA (guanosine2251-2'-O)-methyltransferase